MAASVVPLEFHAIRDMFEHTPHDKSLVQVVCLQSMNWLCQRDVVSVFSWMYIDDASPCREFWPGPYPPLPGQDLAHTHEGRHLLHLWVRMIDTLHHQLYRNSTYYSVFYIRMRHTMVAQYNTHDMRRDHLNWQAVSAEMLRTPLQAATQIQKPLAVVGHTSRFFFHRGSVNQDQLSLDCAANSDSRDDEQGLKARNLSLLHDTRLA